MLNRISFVPRLPREREHVLQPRDVDAVHPALVGKPPRVVAARTDASDVVALQLVEGQLVDRARVSRQPAAVGAADDVGVEPAVVAHHDDAVGGDAHIQLEGGYAERQRACEPRQGVLGREAAGAAVALEVEGSSLGHDGGDDEREKSGHGVGLESSRPV